MARIIQHVRRPHPCQVEIDQLDTPEADLWFGTVVECSCGKQFMKKDDPRDDPYWSPVDTRLA